MKMMNITSHVGKLEKVQRLFNSHNGNPRYLLHVEGAGEFRTAVDSALAYAIPHFVGERVAVEIGTLTPYGDPILRSIRLAEDEEGEDDDDEWLYAYAARKAGWELVNGRFKPPLGQYSHLVEYDSWRELCEENGIVPSGEESEE